MIKCLFLKHTYYREAGTLTLRKDMNAQRITMQDILQAHTALNMPKITK